MPKDVIVLKCLLFYQLEVIKKKLVCSNLLLMSV